MYVIHRHSQRIGVTGLSQELACLPIQIGSGCACQRFSRRGDASDESGLARPVAASHDPECARRVWHDANSEWR